MTPPRARLDEWLVARGFVENRSRARALILAGRVYLDGVKADKAGRPVKGEPAVEVRDGGRRFASRGGEKLDAALSAFGLDVTGLVCLDVGQSTGGFTDCLLSRGAARVVGVDVGYGQLDWRLRQDPRVEVRERVNFRHLTPTDFPAPFDLFVMDVSFISAALLLPVASPLLRPGGAAVVLVKPQFEAGRGEVGKGGIVRDPAVHRAVLADFFTACYHSGLGVAAAIPSPLPGKDGNLEYLAFARREERPAEHAIDIPSVVARAFETGRR